jgi:UDPglucose--hexose-1-phosphate uridylyltransferase
MHGDKYEIDLVLRNNRTDEEHPWGIYHPTANLHHIKKENIGLIEVMGLAILPARLKAEMSELERRILEGLDLRENELTAKHADWAEEWVSKYDDLNADNIHEVVRAEIGKVFAKVLECAGVYKRDDAGFAAFNRFCNTL